MEPSGYPRSGHRCHHLLRHQHSEFQRRWRVPPKQSDTVCAPADTHVMTPTGRPSTNRTGEIYMHRRTLLKAAGATLATTLAAPAVAQSNAKVLRCAPEANLARDRK